MRQSPADKMQSPLLGEPRLAKYLAQPLDFGVGIADEIDLLPRRGRFQLAAHSGDVAAELFD